MAIPIILLILFTSISLFSISLVLLARNVRLSVRIYFSLSAFFLILWVLTLYLSNLDTGLVLFFNRIVFTSPLLGIFFFSLFLGAAFSPSRHKGRLINKLSAAIVMISGSLTVTPWSVASVNPRFENGILTGFNVVPGRYYLIVVVSFLILTVLLIARFYNIYKLANQRQRTPLRIILRALLLTAVVSITTNLVGPLFFGGSTLTNIASNITIVIFISAVAYSVLRYSFLDIRPVIARAASYFIVLSILVVIYATVAALLITGFIEQGGTLVGTLLMAATLIIVTLLYGPFKQFFDKITNRIFYKDAYEPQVFLDQLNQTLVSTIDLGELLRNSAQVIEQTLKAEFCLFGLKETKFRGYRIEGNQNRTFDEKDIKAARSETHRIHHKIIVADELDDEHAVLKRILAKNNIAALGRITPDVKRDSEGIGYLLLGPKKSGFIYTGQDKRLLETTINTLIIAIQNALRFEEIQNFNITLQEEVERQTRQLREANQRLKLLDRTKDDFISMASHQLRTPLTSVKGYLSMTLEGDGGAVSKKQRKLLSQAFISSQRMVYLIADMLNVSRLKTGKFVITPEATDLAEAVRTEIDQLKGTAAARGLTLTYKKPKDFPVLMLDQTKIRQVIMNFADNAIYYTPSGGHIDVELKDTDKTIELTVTDDGIGVPKKEQHRLFSKFYRAGNAKKARPDGTGLGLYMAKKVIIGHGGSVIFKSQEGKGSTFGFSINKSKLEPATVAKAAPTKSQADELDKGLKLET